MSARISFSGKLAEPITTAGLPVAVDDAELPPVVADEVAAVVADEVDLLLLLHAARPATSTTTARIGEKRRRM